MTSFADDIDLDDLDAAYRRALDAGDPDLLPVVGYGEISVAFAWPPEQPVVVAKGLSPFDSQARLARYRELLGEYIAVLADRGVEVVHSELLAVGDRPYILQPLAQCVASEALRAAGPADARRIFAAIVGAAVRAVDERVGLDCQVSNWAWADGRLWLLDVGTPMLRDARGRDRLDVRQLTAALPWAFREPVRRLVAPKLLDLYHDRRRALLDLAGNLHRERLQHLVSDFLAVANPVIDPPLTEAEVARFYRFNSLTWRALQWLRRADRAWQRRVRRRPYPLLMPRRYRR
jgi:hypothetical protein